MRGFCRCLLAPVALALGLAMFAGAGAAKDTEPCLTVELVAEAAAERWHVSLDELRTLPRATFRTHTIWTDGLQTFEGVWMATLLNHLGVTSGRLTLTAVNDYSVTADVADFREGGALVAYLRNGQPMTTRDMGPYWLVYNYDSVPAYRSESIYALSIWQLDRITVAP